MPQIAVCGRYNDLHRLGEEIPAGATFEACCICSCTVVVPPGAALDAAVCRHCAPQIRASDLVSITEEQLRGLLAHQGESRILRDRRRLRAPLTDRGRPGTAPGEEVAAGS